MSESANRDHEPERPDDCLGYCLTPAEKRRAILGDEVIAHIHACVDAAPDPTPELVAELRRIMAHPGRRRRQARPPAKAAADKQVGRPSHDSTRERRQGALMPKKSDRRVRLPAGLIPLLTQRELETYYGVCDWTVLQWIKEGMPVEPVRMTGAQRVHRRFHLEKVKAWHATDARGTEGAA
ncbi:hypothetical protein ACFV2H_31420 [Streptomyces sp. NPDC059629]|uniref:hypothetical protein n=1 Tax=Streptomyces sp. NPDC059629 TaxID=3346889 RepID=UPI0036C7AC6D